MHTFYLYKSYSFSLIFLTFLRPLISLCYSDSLLIVESDICQVLCSLGMSTSC